MSSTAWVTCNIIPPSSSTGAKQPCESTHSSCSNSTAVKHWPLGFSSHVVLPLGQTEQ